MSKFDEVSIMNHEITLIDFKRIGFYPGWAGDCIQEFLLDTLTHINYAFAIPCAEGKLLPIDQPELVHKLIQYAHERKIKVGIAVGGWSYQGIPLEATFVQATESEESRKQLVYSILKVVDDYGFDGVDMDWEYPKPGISATQYEMFMILLKAELMGRGKFLSASVIAYAPLIGNGQTDMVLQLVDWINIMAYDSDDEGGHASVTITNQSLHYWIYQRKVPSHKVVLGLPFYSRPSYKTFCEIVAYDQDAANVDQILMDGVMENYNGLPTIVSKTKWALENVGGVMVWEVTQDTKVQRLSLLNAISQTVNSSYNTFDISKETLPYNF